jgi:microcystin-dependent protein
MARRCGCASDSCSCVVVAGDGMTVTGSGSNQNPFVVTSNVTDIETGFDVQYNNVNVIRGIHRLDFRGTAVHIDPGTDEAVVTVTVPDPTTGALIPTGTVFMFGMSTMPAGWLLCDGTLVSRSTYGNLFSAIGTNFGAGDGVSTFALPNMTDRMPVGISATKQIDGTPGGSATKAIGVANLPPHTHAINHDHPALNTSNAGVHQHDLQKASSPGASGSTLAMGVTTIAQTGPGGIQSAPGHVHSVDVPNFVGNTTSTSGASGTPLDVMPPWRALAFGIKT